MNPEDKAPKRVKKSKLEESFGKVSKIELEARIEKLIKMGIPPGIMFHKVPLVEYLAQYCYPEIQEANKQAYSEESLRKSVFERIIPLFFSERDIQQKFEHKPKFETWFADEGEQFLYTRITPLLAQQLLRDYTKTSPNALQYHSRYEVPTHLHYLFNKSEVLQKNFSDEVLKIVSDFLTDKHQSSSIFRIESFLNTKFTKDHFNIDFLKDVVTILADYDYKKTNIITFLGTALYETNWGKEKIYNLETLKEISSQSYFLELSQKLEENNVDDGNFFEDDLSNFIRNEYSKKYLNEDRFQRIVRFIGRNAGYVDGVFGDASTALINLCVQNEEDYEEVIKYFEKNIKDKWRDLLAMSSLKDIQNDQGLKVLLNYSLHSHRGNISTIVRSISHLDKFGISNPERLFSNLIVPSRLPREELQKFLEKDKKSGKTPLENHFMIFIDPSNSADSKNLQKLTTALHVIKLPEGENVMTQETEQALTTITNIFLNAGVAWAEKETRNSIVEKLQNHYDSEKFIPEMVTDEFIDAHMMATSSSLEHNQTQAEQLLEEYVKGMTYPYKKDVFKSYPYTEEINQSFLKGEFAYDEAKFFSKKNLMNWYRPNEKTYFIEEMDPSGKSLRESQYEHHLKMANGYLELLDLEKSDSKESLVNRKEEMIELRRTAQDSSKRLNWINDIITQIIAIEDLSKKTFSSKVIPSIKIYHELDPIRITMMGNCVQGSCLAFGNHTNNFYSVFTNALDVNKAVFYIEDNQKNIIGRVLCAITNGGELIRFPLYTKNAPNVDLNKYFNTYIKEIANDCKLSLSEDDNSKEYVESLIGEEWYEDDAVQAF